MRKLIIFLTCSIVCLTILVKGDYPVLAAAPGDPCTGCDNCTNTGSCSGGSCTKTHCQIYGDGVTCGPFCTASCPSGYVENSSGGADPCTVHCSPCTNEITCVPQAQEGCDSACGTCGWRNADGSCKQDNRCCHRECDGCYCMTKFNSTPDNEDNNKCEDDNNHPDGGGKDLSCCQPQATPTPTPTPALLGCDDACDSGNDRCSGYTCTFVDMFAGYRCRNSQCPAEQDCLCPAETPTPSLTPTSTLSPTPSPTIIGDGPTNTPIPPTETPYPPTSTPLPTSTPIPTDTPAPGAPTNTPYPTYTPIPTNTPYPPTATPVPTATPTPTTPGGEGPPPTPTPEVRCSCYLLDETGDPDLLKNVQRGQKLHFIGEAYVPHAGAAEAHEMDYWLYLYDEVNNRDIEPEITHSGHLSTGAPNRTETIGGELVDIYQTTWEYTVKPTDPTGIYHVKLEIVCRWKVSLKVRGLYAEAANLTPTPTPNPSLWDLIRKLFGNIIEFFSPGGQTLKLGAFKPAALTPTPTPTSATFLPLGGCTDLFFRVVE